MASRLGRGGGVPAGAGSRSARRPVEGDGALHWAASGPVAEQLAAAAGPRGLEARYLFDQTPLHVAADKGYADVVAVLLAAGANPDALTSDHDTPLDLAGDVRVALLLAAAATPQWTDRPSTPLHDACRRARRDEQWLPVVELLLDRGADPGVRDGFGALPADLLGRHTPAMPTRELLPDEVAVSRQLDVAIHPDGTQAVTNLFSGAVLARWRLAPSITPVEVVPLGRRTRAWGPNGALVFADREAVWLRDWADLTQACQISAELLPDDHYAGVVLSPDGRHLVVAECETLRLVDLDRGVVAGELRGFGDWSVVPRFSPDGRMVAVGNSMQGNWWLTALDVADGAPRRRWERDAGLPSGGGPEIVSDVAFSPDGGAIATWVRPDHGRTHRYRGMVVAVRAGTGEVAWHREVDSTVAAEDAPTSAALSYTPDGTRLAVGLDTGILWLDAGTGVSAGHDPVGRVHALAAHPAVGVLAATDRGLRRVAP